MKKIISAIVFSFVVCCGSLFAESNGAGYKSGDNLFIFEATGCALGFGANQVVTFDHMVGDSFGIGGGGYAYLAGSTSFVLRGVYHGNSWDWGPMKAGWTIGTDWHMYSQDGSISAILAMLPRFVLGVNCQLK